MARNQTQEAVSHERMKEYARYQEVETTAILRHLKSTWLQPNEDLN